MRVVFSSLRFENVEMFKFVPVPCTVVVMNEILDGSVDRLWCCTYISNVTTLSLPSVAVLIFSSMVCFLSFIYIYLYFRFILDFSNIGTEKGFFQETSTVIGGFVLQFPSEQCCRKYCHAQKINGVIGSNTPARDYQPYCVMLVCPKLFWCSV